MSILVTGATGTVGSLIVQRLADAGADVKALVRQRGKLSFPTGVTEVVGDLTDVPSLRAALSSVRTLFLLNAVTPDEVTQALVALNLARELVSSASSTCRSSTRTSSPTCRTSPASTRSSE